MTKKDYFSFFGATVIIWLLFFIFISAPITSAFLFIYTELLLIISIQDYKTHKISLLLLIFLLIAGAASAPLSGTSFTQSVVGAAVPGILFYVLSLKGKIGLGDVIIIISGGMLLSLIGIILALLVTLVLAAIYSIILHKREPKAIAFGPFLSIGIILLICLTK